MRSGSRLSGFTLVETVIAGLVILIVLSALALAARFFFMQSGRVEDRRSALIVARHVMDETIADPALPQPGDSSWVQSAGGMDYRVTRLVGREGPDARLVSVTVSCGDGGAVELTGMTYGR